VHLAVPVVFFAAARFRVPALPVLGLFAGVGVIGLARAFLRRERRAAALVLVASAVALTTVPVLAPEMKPADRATHAFNLGIALEDAGRLEDALAEYERALDLNPDEGRTALQRANTLFRLDRVADAVAAYEALADARPDLSVEVYSNLGVALARTGRTDEAERCYLEALRRNPEYAPARVNLGALYLDAGRFQEAAEAFEVALNGLAVNRGPVLANLAWARWGADDREGAADALRSALAVSPQDPWVRQVARRLRAEGAPGGRPLPGARGAANPER